MYDQKVNRMTGKGFFISIACAMALWACQPNQGGQTQEEGEETTQAEPAANAAQQETFRTIDAAKVADLNNTITSRGIETAEDIMRTYAPEDDVAEGNYAYTITEKELDQNTVQLTLREEGRMDDSVEGRQVVMQLRKDGGDMRVTSIRENYRCWPGRGHENWSAAPCK